MKILFYLRANHDQVKGGDLVQIHSTAKGLEALGVDITFSSDPRLDVSQYDVVHIFNSPRFQETIEFMENAHKHNVPVAFSTIFWSKEDLAIGIAESLKVRVARSILGIKLSRALWRIIKRHQGQLDPQSSFVLERRLFNESTILLPNSEGEMREIETTYEFKNLPYRVVRNAVDATMFKKKPTGKRQPYVLSVGRIENRKNTLKLIEACHNRGLDLTLIGRLDAQDPYAARCQSLIQTYGFKHIPYIEPKDLIPYFYQAQVHAIASWYETPGLSSMEAACGGCAIVSTDLGSTTEYFKDLVYYCDPFSQHSIEEALNQAMNAQPDLALRDLIMKEYTWSGTAQDTLAAYKELIK
jgi:glycosyltransferase involved in cell wall biosynthesis